MKTSIAAPAGLVLVLALGAATAQGSSPAPVPGGRIIVGTETAADGAYILSMAPDGSDPRRLGPMPAWWPVASPDGSRVMLTREAGPGRETVSIVEADAGAVTEIDIPADVPLNLFTGAWSPDGTHLALDGWSEADPTLNGIWIADADGTGLTRLTHAAAGTEDAPIAWSPDGAWILVGAIPSGADHGALEAVSADGTTRITLSNEHQQVWRQGFGAPATWSPDSASVAAALFLDGSQRMSAPFLLHLDGSAAVQLDDPAPYVTGARFSPDGTWIVYDKGIDGGGEHQLFLVRPDGSERTQLTTRDTAGLGLCCAAWSPDGSHLVFQGGAAGTATLFTMPLDGTSATPVRPDLAPYEMVGWR